jgi:ABC-type enterochelin transport system permease subunit
MVLVKRWAWFLGASCFRRSGTVCFRVAALLAIGGAVVGTRLAVVDGAGGRNGVKGGLERVMVLVKRGAWFLGVACFRRSGTVCFLVAALLAFGGAVVGTRLAVLAGLGCSG